MGNELRDKLFLEQNGKCAICNIPEKECYRRLCLDHCHKTQQLRGLLCDKCNHGIGQFLDNPNLLQNAITYLSQDFQEYLLPPIISTEIKPTDYKKPAIGEKRCSKCGQCFHVNVFPKDKGSTDGLHSWCKECKRRQDRLYKARVRYGHKINEDGRDQLLKVQNNCCAICHTPESETRRRLEIDHCHTTGSIRGLLCEKCNKGIGLFSDDKETIQKAVEYLRKWETYVSTPDLRTAVQLNSRYR